VQVGFVILFSYMETEEEKIARINREMDTMISRSTAVPQSGNVSNQTNTSGETNKNPMNYLMLIGTVLLIFAIIASLARVFLAS